MNKKKDINQNKRSFYFNEYNQKLIFKKKKCYSRYKS